VHPKWREICDDFIIATNYTSKEELDSYCDAREAFNYATYSPYLRYEETVRRVQLGQPEFPETAPVWEIFRNRRSRRNFLGTPISLNQLNVLLWCAQGRSAEVTTAGKNYGYQLRTAPSSGALYPIETYLLVNFVSDLQPGLYHLDVKQWELEGLRFGDLREEAYAGLLEQPMTRRAAVNIVWTAVLPRCRQKYFERAYRYIWWDVGHISENLHLAATALGLGSCAMGAWYDSKVNESLGIDGTEHFSVLTAAVGQVEGVDWRSDRR
jgi:SagB-type dehydrogenase family enzyme